MEIKNGQVGFTKDEIKDLEYIGFTVDWHTPYYLNGLTAELFGYTVGFHNWLDNTDCWIGEHEVKIRDIKQYKAVEQLMRSMVETKIQLSRAFL